jgi:3D (Asp-Asp-Asp) domain-containing protein
MPYSKPKQDAIMKAAEPALFALDRDTDETTEELVERIVIQARFIVETNSPVPNEHKKIAQSVVDIANGPEPVSPATAVLDQLADQGKIDAPGTPTRDVVEAIIAADPVVKYNATVIEGYGIVYARDLTSDLEIHDADQAARFLAGERGTSGKILVDEIIEAVSGDRDFEGYMGKLKVTVEWEPWEESD